MNIRWIDTLRLEVGQTIENQWPKSEVNNELAFVQASKDKTI